MFVHPLSLRGVFSSILYVTFHFKIQKKTEKKLAQQAWKIAKTCLRRLRVFPNMVGWGTWIENIWKCSFCVLMLGLSVLWHLNCAHVHGRQMFTLQYFFSLQPRKPCTIHKKGSQSLTMHLSHPRFRTWQIKSFPIAYSAHTLYVLFCRHGNRCKQFCLGNCSQK